jgi:hypothetical protein
MLHFCNESSLCFRLKAMLAEPATRALVFHAFKQKVLEKVGTIDHMKSLHGRTQAIGAAAASGGLSDAISATRRTVQMPKDDMIDIYQEAFTELADTDKLAQAVKAEVKALNHHKKWHGKLRHALFGAQTRSVDMLQDQISREMRNAQKHLEHAEDYRNSDHFDDGPNR